MANSAVLRAKTQQINVMRLKTINNRPNLKTVGFNKNTCTSGYEWNVGENKVKVERLTGRSADILSHCRIIKMWKNLSLIQYSYMITQTLKLLVGPHVVAVWGNTNVSRFFHVTRSGNIFLFIALSPCIQTDQELYTLALAPVLRLCLNGW